MAAIDAAIADTGVLVALLDRAERHHVWAAERVKQIEAPLLICEPVLSEAMHLLARVPAAQDRLFGLLEKRALKLAFRIEEHVPSLRALHRKYRDKPMSLADACIVRMAELYVRHCVFTLDSDFFVYRKHGREPLSLIHPLASSSS
jgi:predicted nucleic acid-binding protein